MTKEKGKMITVRLDPDLREETLKNVEEWIGYGSISFLLNCVPCLDFNEVEKKIQSVDNLSISYIFEYDNDRIELSMFFQDDESIDISVIKNKGNAFTLCNNNKPLILLLNDKSDLTEQSTDHKYIYMIKRSDLSGMEKFTELTKLVICGEMGGFITRDSGIKNVDDLKNLTKITYLDFIECGNLQNVDGLKNCVKLETLDLSYCNSLQNVDGLKNLPNLTTLDLSFCETLENVYGKKNMTNLTESLENTEGLIDLTKFKFLNLNKDEEKVQKDRDKVGSSEIFAKVKLRSSYEDLLTEEQVETMIKDKGFSETWTNKSGVFENDLVSETISGDDVIIDRITGLMWNPIGSPDDMSLSDAEKWIKDLNNKGYAGFSNWRLPTMEELSSLLEIEENPDDFHIDPRFSNTPNFVWTGDSSDSNLPWIVCFDGCDVRTSEAGFLHYVIPVRS